MGEFIWLTVSPLIIIYLFLLRVKTNVEVEVNMHNVVNVEGAQCLAMGLGCACMPSSALSQVVTSYYTHPENISLFTTHG